MHHNRKRPSRSAEVSLGRLGKAAFDEPARRPNYCALDLREEKWDVEFYTTLGSTGPFNAPDCCASTCTSHKYGKELCDDAEND